MKTEKDFNSENKNKSIIVGAGTAILSKIALGFSTVGSLITGIAGFWVSNKIMNEELSFTNDGSVDLNRSKVPTYSVQDPTNHRIVVNHPNVDPITGENVVTYGVPDYSQGYGGPVTM